MIGNAETHPVQLLYEISQQCREVAQNLPKRIDIARDWSGIGFRIGDFQLVAPLNQVNEILHTLKLTSIPGTRSWVRGVANVRGTLLPVMDLREFLGTAHTSRQSKSRVIVIKYEELTSGLLVDEVLGLKHFKEEEKIGAVTKFDESLRKFIRGAFRQNGVETLVFSMEALTLDPNFYQVAV